MKRTLPAIALITGLTLAGCSGGQDGGQDEDGSDSAAEEATQLDEATLKELLESTDAQGQSFTYIDTSEASGSEALKALDNAEFEPSECKDLSMAALGAAEASDSTTVTGVSSDNTLSVGLVSLADEDAAGSQLRTSSKVTEECSDVTISSQGIEMSMDFEPFDTEVAGADETVGVKATIDAGGQTVLDPHSISATVGNNIVTAANVVDVGEATVSQAAEACVHAVSSAGGPQPAPSPRSRSPSRRRDQHCWSRRAHQSNRPGSTARDCRRSGSGAIRVTGTKPSTGRIPASSATTSEAKRRTVPRPQAGLSPSSARLRSVRGSCAASLAPAASPTDDSSAEDTTAGSPQASMTDRPAAMPPKGWTLT